MITMSPSRVPGARSQLTARAAPTPVPPPTLLTLLATGHAPTVR